MQDGATVHCLKMVHTVSEDLDGHMIACTHIFNFSRGQMPLRKTEWILLFRRGRELHLDLHLTSRGSVPLYDRLCEYHSDLCYNFVIFLKTMCIVKEKEHGVLSLVGAPLPSHTRPVLPHTHLNLDLNPKIIQCYYYKNGMECQPKENWANFDVKWAITHIFPELYLSFCLLELDGKEVLTSAFITSLNSLSSLSRILLYSQTLQPWYLFSLLETHSADW